MKRKAALFTPKWPAGFSTVVERKWAMHIGPPTDKQTVMHVSYHETGLTVDQRDSFISFLFGRSTPYMHEWLAEVATRLINDRLTSTWVQEQNFCKDLATTCGLNITAIFNFPSEEEELPANYYPLAFILSSN